MDPMSARICVAKGDSARIIPATKAPNAGGEVQHVRRPRGSETDDDREEDREVAVALEFSQTHDPRGDDVEEDIEDDDEEDGTADGEEDIDPDLLRGALASQHGDQ